MHLYKQLFTLLLSGIMLLSLAACSNQTRTPDDSSKEAEVSSAKYFDDKEIDPEFYLGETVFIGDSRTKGLLSYEFLPPEQVYAIDGSTQKTIRDEEFIQLSPDGEYLSVEEAVKERQPRRIVVAFGVNAIPVMDEKTFIKEFDILLEELTEASPNSKIVIQSILPVSWWKYQEIPLLTNEAIEQYNQLLGAYCVENGYAFFDISGYFQDEEGCLAQRYDGGDGLHFRRSFYEKYMELLIELRP